MKRIIIICEGQTEQEFCLKVLQPHFSYFGILIHAPTIKKTGGGIVNWVVFQKEILLHLQRDKSAWVTTLIDYYGLYNHHQFPNWEEAKNIPDKNNRMKLLEDSMRSFILDAFRYRFIPYIQLHEFESLLFSEKTVFDTMFETTEFSDYAYLSETIATFENPEMINNDVLTAPSKRLERIIIGYKKNVYGNILAESIGLSKIRAKCLRFNEWIATLESFGN